MGCGSSSENSVGLSGGLSGNKDATLPCKLVLLGASGVGKSSLLGKYVKDQFNPDIAEPTIGAAFAQKTIQLPNAGRKLKLQLWDTAGMERFQSLTPIYVQAAHVCLLVYSLDDIQSFRALKFWYNQLRRVNEKCPVVLVGNKADLGEGKRQVSTTEAREFAKEIEAVNHYETSCLNADSVQTLFIEAAEAAAQLIGNGASSSEF